MRDNSRSAIDVVKSYLSSLGPTSEDFWRSFDIYFDAETVWENVGMARTVGRDEAVSFARAFPIRFDHMRVEDLKVAADGQLVLNERIDHFCDARGNILLTIRVAGSFLIEGNIIREWRDYFDVGGVMANVQTLANS